MGFKPIIMDTGFLKQLPQDGTLTVNGNIDGVDYIDFNTAYTDGHTEGRLSWDTDDGTLELGLPGGEVKLQIGQEHIIRCRNTTGDPIPNGTPVYVTGSQANRPTIAPADASIPTTAGVLGLTTEEINDNANGYVTTRGLVRDVNTSTFNEGDFLWLDTTPGDFTVTIPDAPYSRVAIGDVIRSHQDEGVIAVRIILIHQYEIASGVKFEANTDGDFLRWDAANSWWDRHGDSSIDHGSISGLEDDDHLQYLHKTGWELNFAQTGKADITIDNPSRTLSLTPTGADFEFWVEGIKYTKTIAQTVTFDDLEGIWFVYFNNSGVLTASQTVWNINANDWAGVAILYWDADSNIHSILGPEFHSYAMNPGTHHYLHYTFGTRWESGLGVAINGDNLDVGAGKLHDEDIEINITDSAAGGTWQQDLTPASLPIFYRSGTLAWRVTAASTTPVYLDTNVPQVNVDSGGGVWVWDAVGVARYFAYWVIASNDQDTPVVLIPGQEDAGTLNAARDGNKLSDMNFGDLPVVEAKVIARVIMQRQGGSPYYNLVEVDDYRQVVDEPAGGGSIVGDHGNLVGLGDDDHPHYVTYIGASGPVDLGAENLTTTGTVVGSNIPAPTVDNQVLISTATDVASWSTAGNNELLGSNGSGEVAWESKTFGYNIPANTAPYQVYVGTGVGTAGWTTDLRFLTFLSVDNITIDGAVISSNTGDISFLNENLTTTGTFNSGSALINGRTTCQGIVVPIQQTVLYSSSATDIWQNTDLLHITSGDMVNGFGPGLTFSIQDDTAGPFTIGGIYTVRAGADNSGDLEFYTSNTGSYASRGRFTHDGNFEVDAGTVTGTNIPTPTVTDKLLTSTGADTATWQTPPFGYNIPANTAAYQVYAGTGVGTADWTTDLIGLTSLTVDNITIDGATITSDNGIVSLLTDDLFTFGKVEATNIPTPQGDNQVLISTSIDNALWVTSGKDKLLGSNSSGEAAWEDKPFGYGIPANTAAYQVYAGTGVGTAAWTTDLIGLTSLTVDNITIDGDTISSDTGEINVTDGIKAPLPSMFTQGAGTTYTGLVTGFATGETTGTCVIDLPTAFLNTMCNITIDGHNYSTLGGWSVNLGGYASASGGFWINHHASIQGTPPFTSIRLGYNGNTGKACIMLGTTSTSWSFATVAVSKASMTYFQHEAYQDSWAVAWYSSEVNFFSQPGYGDPNPVATNQDVPSPVASDLALVSTAAAAFEWTATPPWAMFLTSDITVYVRTTGNDTTGDGSSGLPFLTLTRTIEYLAGLHIGVFHVLVDIGEGVFTEETLVFHHPFGSQVTWQGVSERISSQDTASISATGTSLGVSNLYRYDVTMVLPVGKSVSVGDYIAIREVTGGSNPKALYGCHYVSDWNGGTRTATVQIVYYTGCPKATGTVTCAIELIKTVIAFDNKHGIVINGPYHAGLWKGLVLQGNYDATHTASSYGVYIRNGAVLELDTLGLSGTAVGIVGFYYGAYILNNSEFNCDYTFISKIHSRGLITTRGSITSLAWGRVSGISGRGLSSTLGSYIGFTTGAVVAQGPSHSLYSIRNSFLDARNAYVKMNVADFAMKADNWACIDGTGASQTDGFTPVTDGDNDGSYIIGFSEPGRTELTADATVYVRTTGNDTTGTGSSGAPFLTVTRTLEYLGTLNFGVYNVTVSIGEGVFNEPDQLVVQHPSGSQITWKGFSNRISSQDTASIGSTLTAIGTSNLSWYAVTMVLPVDVETAVGQYILIRTVSGGSNPQALYGCHYVSGWDGGTRTATIQIVQYNTGCTKATGTVTCDIDIIRTVIAFDNTIGIYIDGPWHGGRWQGLVVQGNYDPTNKTTVSMGAILNNGANIAFDVVGTAGESAAIVGFLYGVFCQNTGSYHGDYSVISRIHYRAIVSTINSSARIPNGIISGVYGSALVAATDACIYAYHAEIVGSGPSSTVYSIHNSFIDTRYSFVDLNNADYSFRATGWAAVEATGATQSDGVTPVTDGNNDGSYIIGI